MGLSSSSLLRKLDLRLSELSRLRDECRTLPLSISRLLLRLPLRVVDEERRALLDERCLSSDDRELDRVPSDRVREEECLLLPDDEGLCWWSSQCSVMVQRVQTRDKMLVRVIICVVETGPVANATGKVHASQRMSTGTTETR